MSYIWNINTIDEVRKYNINGEGEYDEITTDDVINYAKNKGYKKFEVYDSDGNILTEDEFPVKKDITITPYNIAG